MNGKDNILTNLKSVDNEAGVTRLVIYNNAQLKEDKKELIIRLVNHEKLQEENECLKSIRR